jgi:predicted nucleotidyltransferase
MALDIEKLRSQCLEVRDLLMDHGYRTDTVLLFGSHAKGTATEKSDIDLAFVSIHFGIDPFKENSLLNLLFFKRISNAEGVAIPLSDYLDTFPISPIAWEVKKTGISLF